MLLRLQAMSLANAQGIDVVLGDRDINETLGRLNGKNKAGSQSESQQVCPHNTVFVI